MLLLGLDIGGTKIEAALVQMDVPSQVLVLPSGERKFKIIERRRCDSERHFGYEHFLRKATELVRSLGVGINEIYAIGVGLPGAVDPVSLKMANGNSGMLTNQDVKEDLRKQLGFSGPILICNDANCFALAEALAGAGTKHPGQNLGIGIILGTGVGGGIYLNSRIYSGRRGAAGEWGHVPLYTGGLPCFCGKEGCAETYLSGPGFEAGYRRQSGDYETRSAKEIFAMARGRQPQALASVLQYKRQLGLFLGMIAQKLDPDYLVLGGGMSKEDDIYPGLQEEMTKHLFVKTNPPPIYKHELGDSAGVLGAAFLALM